jgi:hypothetical protein
MPYIQRDTKGRIASLNLTALSPDMECLAPDHPEVLAFLYGDAQQQEMLALDLGFIRVIEDLIDILVSRNVICFTDLPAPVQAKLNRRQTARANCIEPDYNDDIIRV